jgi:hypothetical protein
MTVIREKVTALRAALDEIVEHGAPGLGALADGSYSRSSYAKAQASW